MPTASVNFNLKKFRAVLSALATPSSSEKPILFALKTSALPAAGIKFRRPIRRAIYLNRRNIKLPQPSAISCKIASVAPSERSIKDTIIGEPQSRMRRNFTSLRQTAKAQKFKVTAGRRKF